MLRVPPLPLRRPRAAHAVLAAAAAFLLALVVPAVADPPPGYYDPASGLTGDALRLALNDIINNHVSLSYDAAKDRLWDTVDNRGGFVQCIYSGRTSTNLNPDTNNMNTEHTWPQSRGASVSPRRSDLHHLFVVDSVWNSRRGSIVYRTVTMPDETSPIGAKFDGGFGFEPAPEYRGDIARAILYFHIRYLLPVGDSVPVNGSDSSTADDNMGILSDMLMWNATDPPSAYEMNRNDRIYAIQNNRNPFIDHPEYACLIWAGVACSGGDMEPPAAPTGLMATGGAGRVDLNWADNAEGDLFGYNVYRGLAMGGPFTKLNTSLVGPSEYVDFAVTAQTPYFYHTTAVDFSSNESSPSAIVSATPTEGGTGGGGPPWINEIHYDNVNADVFEFIEIAGPAGTDLGGWSLVLYNGSNNMVYDTTALSGVIPDHQNCLGTLTFSYPENGLQNGAPDGVALVDPSSTVLQFLSYEGTFTAGDGPASGMLSVDIGVSEGAATPLGFSLQLGGTGNRYGDFTWQAEMDDTPTAVNVNQTFTNGCGDTTAPAAPANLVATPGDNHVLLDWDNNDEPDLAGYHVWRSLTSGSGFTRLTVSPIAISVYDDTTAANGTTYFYLVRAMDLVANESDDSNEVMATPQPPAPNLSAGVILK